VIGQQQRQAAKFTQYGLAAAEEALDDADWKPTDERDLEATVRLLSFQLVGNMPSGLTCATRVYVLGQG
jgi:3-oxoacyl-(acyl-carrier-protein) synthase